MDTLTNWLIGRLSTEARVWTAIAPALLLSAYFLVGLAIYAVRVARRGPYRDAELEARGSSALAGMWIRLYFAWVMQPVWRLLLRTGIPATAVTTLSVLLATASGVAVAAGRFALGGWLYIFAGICDFLDGRLARARGSVSKSGAALDSILDRYSDAAVLVGLAWFYRGSWVLLATQLALVGSALVPYIRARGEAVGVTVREVGLMQRAERILYLGVAVALSPVLEVALDPTNPRPLHRLAVVGVVLLAVSTQLTALQRLLFLLRVLDERPPRHRFSWVGKGSLVRTMAAAALATAVDFSLVFTLVSLGHTSAPVATALGCLLGAFVNFSINRLWTFSTSGSKLPQVGRYGFVSVSSALLNAGGVAVLLLLPAIDYRLAWWLVRGAVFVAWNFPLQRDYVFSPPSSREVVRAR